MANLWRCVPCGRDTQHHCSFPRCVEGVCNMCFTADDSDDARFCVAHLSPLPVSICRLGHRRALYMGDLLHFVLAPRLAGAPPPFSAGLTNASLVLSSLRLVLLLHSADQKLHLLWLLLLDLQRPRYVDSTLPRSLPAATSLLPSGFLATHVLIHPPLLVRLGDADRVNTHSSSSSSCSGSSASSLPTGSS
jgi:hypothetical protein